MAEIVLLRHFMTQGNLEGRYIGSRTDEPLCREGIRLFESRRYPAVDCIYASPMRRCVETAQVIWGSMAKTVQSKGEYDTETELLMCGCSTEAVPFITLIPEFRECDFGDFENKNYQELNGDLSYQAWIDSGGTLPFPGGESMEAFRNRCQAGFVRLVRETEELERRLFSRGKHTFRVALVVHGGTIMAILERFKKKKKGYFDYQVKNGCGYILTPVEGTDLWNYQCLP